MSIQAHFQVEEPFWEMAGNMWTDGPIERVGIRTKKNPNDPEALVIFINGPESLKYRLMTVRRTEGLKMVAQL